VADQDHRDFQALQTARKRVSDLYSVQSAQHRQQQALLQGKLKKEQNLQRLATDKSRVVKQLKNSASKRLQAIRDMKKREAESAERVADLIKEIQEAQRRGKRLAELPPFDFLGHQGALDWPVLGKVVVQFGRQQDPELKTWTFNRGINIAATEGTAVQAVAPGEVVLVDWFPGYGRFVLLRHPGEYFSLYGHLNEDQVQTGEILAEGTTVGTAGSTGRLDGKPQLHFEIMKGENPMDPLEWLKR
jgi:septal ring factor EnvC (AmiA/AmiB activator)